MKTNVNSVTYTDGQRIETVQQIYTKADDYATLGRLYMALGQKLAQHETTENEEEKAALQNEINLCHELITKQQEYIDGYNT